MQLSMFLNFSDAAKFADIARNLFQNHGLSSSFSFFGGGIFRVLSGYNFPASGTLPFTPVSIAAFYAIFGINDFAVIANSFFYFLLTLIFVFLLSKNVFKSKLTAILSTLVVGFNYDLIHYATNGASESPFIFEIVSTLYLISLKKSWANALAVLLFAMMYFTRPQAFIFITGGILFYLLLSFKTKKALIYFSLLMVLGLLIDKYVLWRFNGTNFLYSVTVRGVDSINQYIPGSATSTTLRVGISTTTPILDVIKKIFYNLYNFYKLTPQIVNPYMFALFVISLFRWTKDRLYNSLKFVSIFVILINVLVTAISIPLFRYLHSVVPLIYLFATEVLVWIVAEIYTDLKEFKIIKYGFTISKQTIVNITMMFLVLFLAIGHTLGIFILDSRFERNTHNVGKPPVYAKLSWILRENTEENQTIVTNLDTWGTWYGERRTVWFPLEPKQLINPATEKIPFDAIYLTSYKIDDENYYMGESWRQIFNNPTSPDKWLCDGCEEIKKEFKLVSVYKVPATDNYEREEASAVLLLKK